MVRTFPRRQIVLIADQIARVEAHRGLLAVYVQLVAPLDTDCEKLVSTLRSLLEERGSSAEISVVCAKVERIALQRLEFSMDDA